MTECYGHEQGLRGNLRDTDEVVGVERGMVLRRNRLASPALATMVVLAAFTLCAHERAVLEYYWTLTSMFLLSLGAVALGSLPKLRRVAGISSATREGLFVENRLILMRSDISALWIAPPHAEHSTIRLIAKRGDFAELIVKPEVMDKALTVLRAPNPPALRLVAPFRWRPLFLVIAPTSIRWLSLHQSFPVVLGVTAAALIFAQASDGRAEADAQRITVIRFWRRHVYSYSEIERMEATWNGTRILLKTGEVLYLRLGLGADNLLAEFLMMRRNERAPRTYSG